MSDARALYGAMQAACGCPRAYQPTPTLKEAREAARDLAGPAAQIVHAFLSSLPDDLPPGTDQNPAQ